MSQEKIMLFIPAYNCEKQIIRVLRSITPEISSLFTEIVVVENRSTDETIDSIKEGLSEITGCITTLLRNDENYGLGGSHKVAFNYAITNGYDYLIVLHGDDQGRISDFLSLLQNGDYKNYDCVLGSRFMNGSILHGYSKLRIFGNYFFNFLFSLVVHKKINDLGSGLNLYKVDSLKIFDFEKYPDTLYFNDFMILASCHYHQKIKFYPISWREEDQISNNKLVNFSISLLKMLWFYSVNRKQFFSHDHRIRIIDTYSSKKLL